MADNNWRKRKQNHLLLMILCCIMPIMLLIAFLLLFKAKSDYWIWLIILLCPLMHILITSQAIKK